MGKVAQLIEHLANKYLVKVHTAIQKWNLDVAGLSPAFPPK